MATSRYFSGDMTHRKHFLWQRFIQICSILMLISFLAPIKRAEAIVETPSPTSVKISEFYSTSDEAREACALYATNVIGWDVTMCNLAGNPYYLYPWWYTDPIYSTYKSYSSLWSAGHCDNHAPNSMVCIQPFTMYSFNMFFDRVCPAGQQIDKDTGVCTLDSKNLAACSFSQQNACTNPINTGTGNKYQREIDYVGSGAFPLRVERTYNSASTQVGGVLGAKWRSYYDRAIVLQKRTTFNKAVLKRGDGQIYNFTQAAGSSVWAADADVIGSLSRQVDALGNTSGWQFINANDETEAYDAAGRLVTITNRAGVAQTLAYMCGVMADTPCAPPTESFLGLPVGLLVSVTDSWGRQIRYTYDGSSRVSKVTDPSGAVYTYGYSGTLSTDNLVSVTYPDGKIRGYSYGESGYIATGTTQPSALTGLIDEDGNRYSTWSYDDQSRAVSSEHGVGINKVTLTYNADGSTTVTDSLGTTRTYNFQTILGVVRNTGITGQPCNNCSAGVGYDTNGNIASRTDFNGNLTCYSYDLTRNLESVRVEGLPSGSVCPTNLATYTPVAGSVERKTTTQWHASYRLPTAIAEPLRITSFSYDTKGNLLGRTVQGTTDATGATGMAATASGTARITAYTYNAAGQILTENGPRTDVQDVTQYTYDTQSNLATVKNALNRITTLGGYDANGRPATITDPNGLITSLGYDARGRLLTRNVGGETTGYTYDGVGNLTGVTLPNGASYTYTYDAAHRLTQITDALGNQLTYTLDNAGNRTQEQLFDSTGTLIKKHSRVFDALSRLQQDIGAVNQTTTYTYDANGNLTGVTDPLNRQTTNVYDALNRLSQVSNPDTGVVKYAYDGLDQLKQVTDPRNLVTSYTRDGLSNLSQTVSPDTGTTNVTYDAAGNVLTSTDAKGQKTTYTYDALNRVLTISYSGGTSPAQSVTYQYDQGVNGLGHLTSMTDITGTTSFSYDAHGRLLTETKVAYAATYVTRYSYDAQGKLTSMTYPSGRLVSYSYDTIGRVSQVSTTLSGQTQVLVSGITYHPFGGVKSMLRGNGKTYTRLVDQDGRIASYTVNGKSMSIGYNPASEIALITDSTNPTLAASYSYDPMSRLTNYTQGSISQGFVYDKVGNRTSQTVGATSTTYGYAATSNRLASTQVGAAAAKTVTQDVNGATTSDGVKQYAYDIRGRMSQATTAQGTVNYFVNALGLRTRKQATFTTTDTVYLYDTDAHLIGEFTTGTIKPAREYVWLGDMPVAVMQ